MEPVISPAPRRRRSTRGLILASVLVMAALVATPAYAELSETADPSDMTNGRVYSIVRAGDRIYLAGEFTQVYSQPGGTAVPRANVAAFFADTGRLDPNWVADTDNRVFRLAASSSRLYMGGDFRHVNGVLKKRFVAVDLETGAVDQAFESSARAKVTAILVDGPHVYIGGDFEWVEGFDRFHLARVDAATGAVDPGWDPQADHRIWDMDLSPNGETLYLGGTFTRIEGEEHNHIAALDKDTGNVISSFDGDSQYDTRNIAVDVQGVYAAVEGPGGRVSAFDLQTGDRLWVRHADGDAQAIAAAHGRVYAGGHWNGFDGASRPRLVTLDPATGAVDGSFAPDINSGGALGVWDIVADGPDLLVGGDFTRVAGLSQHRFARFSETAPPNAPPSVTITDPADGTTVDTDTAVVFAATATDAEDGDLSDAVSWSSDLDGSLGIGASITSTLSAGTHTVTATVLDGASQSATDSVAVDVTAPGSPPVVTITEPADGTTVDTETAVVLTATATDAEDGDLSAAVSWSSDLDGPLGTGGTITATLSLGAHTVTATVTDSDGHVASHAIAVNVELPGEPPSVGITAPASGTSVTSGTQVTLEGSASDPDDGDLTDAIAWSSDRDGDLGTGGSLTVTLSDGTHVVTATVVDSHDRQAQDAITVTVEGGVLVSSISQLGYGGRTSDKHLNSTVTVTDSDGFAVTGASVSVTLLRASDPSMNGATTFATAQGTTSGGTTVMSFKNLPSGCYRTVVTAVTADGSTWDGVSPLPDPDPWCN